MRHNKTTIIRFLFLLLITFITSYAYAGLPKLVKPRQWNGQDLTWDDFQIRHLQTDTLRPWDINVDIERDIKSARSGNTRYEYTDFTAYMYPTSSWYDPDKVSEWDLLSSNVIFNLIELNSRILQKEYNLSYDQEKQQQADEHALNEVRERIREFSLGTDYLKDTVAMTNYARNIQRELKMLPRTEPQQPSVSDNWYYGWSLGYCNMNPVFDSNDHMNSVNGGNISFLMGFNRLEFEIGINAGKTRINTPGYFKDNDWLWRADDAYYNITSYNLGYKVYSGQYLRLIPKAGIGYSRLIQSDPDHPDDSSKDHKIYGLNLNAGICLDYILFRNLHQYQISTKYYLRLTPNISYTKIGGREIWSANVNLTFSFDLQAASNATLLHLLF